MSVVEEGIIARLITRTPVSALVGDRVYSGVCDFGQGFPSIGVQLQEDEPQLSMTGEVGISQATVLLNCWSEDNPAKAKEVREAVRLTHNGFAGGHYGPVFLRAIFLKDGGDIEYPSPDNEELRAFGVQLEAEVWYRHQIAAPVG